MQHCFVERSHVLSGVHFGVTVLTLSQVNSVVERNNALLLDGGLATELERQGYDLDHDLWSARLLMTDPEAIRKVHRSYLEAGSRCITTASYQASFAGFAAMAISETQAKQLLTNSVSIAQQAVVDFLDGQVGEINRPIVAASIGPYGACLADGSEYRGNYRISSDALRYFHAPRLETICQAQPDLLACETIPSKQEAEVLKQLLAESAERMAWVSFSCADGEHISDGTPLQECAELLQDCDQVFAVGINCTAPQHVKSLIGKIRAGAPNKQIVVYPNSGQLYDVERRIWTGRSSAADFGRLSKEWLAAGATLIGGCCQTGADHIGAIRASIFD